MSTAVVNPNFDNNAIYGKPAMQAPGEVITQTTVTTTGANNYAAPSKGFNVFASIFGVLAGVGFFCGAVLILTAMALLLRDSTAYYTQIGGLLVAGFSLWFLASLLNWIPNFGGFSKTNRSGYHIFNVFANLLSLIGFALLIAGAGCWLSSNLNSRYAGEILWIIGSSFWLVSLLLRDMGIRYDTMNTYKNYPVLPTTNNNNQQKSQLGAHISSVWSNALATDLYLISSVLLLLGSIMFLARGRNAGINGYTSDQFQVAAGVMWIVAAAIIILASIAHCVSRR
jgi:hypothetical protein